MTTIYLIRHAQSHPSIRMQDSQWPLSTRGRAQAEALSLLLEPLGIRELWSSPYRRCLETVAPFAKRAGLRFQLHDGLRERNIAGGIVDNFSEIWSKSWKDFGFALPGCESSTVAQARFVQTVGEILRTSDAATIGVCAHGNVLGLLLNHIDEANGRAETESLLNPDVLRVLVADDQITWDRTFRLPGIKSLATPHTATPIERE